MKYALAAALLVGLSSAPTPPAGAKSAEPRMTVKAIEVVAVAEAEEQLLRSRIPFQAGDVVGRPELGAAARAVRELDAYLTYKFLETTSDDGRTEVTIRIAGIGDRPATVYIQEPEVIYRVEPEYPESLRQQGVGSVELEATIGLDGKPRDIAILSGDPAMADAASKAVLQWRYRPAFADAQPVEVRRSIMLRFPSTGISKGAPKR